MSHLVSTLIAVPRFLAILLNDLRPYFAGQLWNAETVLVRTWKSDATKGRKMMERQEKRNLTAAASMYIKAGMYPNAGRFVDLLVKPEP